MGTEQSKFDTYWKKTRGSYIIFLFIMSFVLFGLLKAINNVKKTEYYDVAVEYVKSTREIIDITGKFSSIGYFVQAETSKSPYWVKLKVIGENKSLEVQVFLLKKETGWIAESHKLIN